VSNISKWTIKTKKKIKLKGDIENQAYEAKSSSLLVPNAMGVAQEGEKVRRPLLPVVMPLNYFRNSLC